MDRNEWMLNGLDRETVYGIEIGPFYNPIAPKAKGWKTTIVDYGDERTLRDIAENHSARAIREMALNIEPVDVVWRGVNLGEACLKIRPRGFDYLIASHVIEHIPDIIGFFQQASALANDDFLMSLAVPDCRLTFDFFKGVSNTADALAAHRERRTLHSPETMFEAYAYMTAQNGAGAWRPGARGTLALPNSLEISYRLYTDYLSRFTSATQEYVDAHCWYFTPSSFELMILELNGLGRIDFVVRDVEASD